MNIYGMTHIHNTHTHTHRSKDTNISSFNAVQIYVGTFVRSSNFTSAILLVLFISKNILNQLKLKSDQTNQQWKYIRLESIKSITILTYFHILLKCLNFDMFFVEFIPHLKYPYNFLIMEYCGWKGEGADTLNLLKLFTYLHLSVHLSMKACVTLKLQQNHLCVKMEMFR